MASGVGPNCPGSFASPLLAATARVGNSRHCEAWEYDPNGETLPELKFLLRFDSQDEGKFSDGALEQLFRGTPGMSLNKIEATSLLDLVSLLTGVFNLQKMTTKLVTNSGEADVQTVSLHLAILRHGVNLVHLISSAQKVMSNFTSSTSGLNSLVEQAPGEKRAGRSSS